MKSLRPQPRLLAMWRALSIAAAVPPAFLCSFLLEAGSAPWILSTCGWVAAFLYMYLYWLPGLYKSLSYRVSGGCIELRSGMLGRKSVAIPLVNIQFTAVTAYPWEQIFGLCSLRVIAPGGQMRIPGLKRGEADSVCELLLGGE